MIPSLLLLSKVCFPFVGPSLLPNTSCPKHWRTNGRSIPRPQAPPVGAAGGWSRAHPTNSPSAAQVQPTRRPLAACLGVGPLWPGGIGGVFLLLGRCSGTSHSQRAPGKPYIHVLTPAVGYKLTPWQHRHQRSPPQHGSAWDSPLLWSTRRGRKKDPPLTC